MASNPYSYSHVVSEHSSKTASFYLEQFQRYSELKNVQLFLYYRIVKTVALAGTT